MTLKPKIEAIIYAAEEPVTLAQLVSLLGEEAQFELDRLAAQQSTLALAPGPLSDSDSEPDSLVDSSSTDDSDDATPAAGASSDAQPPSAPKADSGPQPDPRHLAREQRQRERALRDFLRAILDELIRDYSTPDRGLEIREVASGFRLGTKPEYHDAVRGFARGLKPPLKLSLPALETLAVVAYKQPITAPEVAEIRGVESAGVLGSLVSRKLVTTAGRKQVVGRPILYKTTKDFLLRFGLRDINELPSIEEFERMAGDLADAQQEEIDMASPNSNPDAGHTASDLTSANLREQENTVEPQADGNDGQENPSLPVDGRLSGVDVPEPQPIDSPAGDAAIQNDQTAAEEE